MRSPIGMKRIRNKGFTLIELTLVTFLILVIIGLSVPIFKKTFSDLSAKDASFSISKLINYAQEMAVLEKKNYRINFNFQKGTYQLFEPDILAKPPVYKKVQGRFGKLFSLPKGVSLEGKKSGMTFYPDGHCDEVRVDILVKGTGYSVIVKRFGNMVEMKEFEID